MGLISKNTRVFKKQISQMNKEGSLNIVITGNNVISLDVKITSQDIEGWLCNSNGITVCLTFTISEN
jgi:isoleucyl-tRNA synthetase